MVLVETYELNYAYWQDLINIKLNLLTVNAANSKPSILYFQVIRKITETTRS